MSGRDTDKFRQQAIDTANLLLKAADIIENPDPSRPTSAHNHGAENLSDRSRLPTSVVGMWRLIQVDLQVLVFKAQARDLKSEVATKQQNLNLRICSTGAIPPVAGRGAVK